MIKIDITRDKIDTSNLIIGSAIKNYKELCNVINQPILAGGDSKKAQIKEFERYFEFQKSGQKFIILNVHERPLDKIDARKTGNNSIYTTYIETILLKYLSTQEDYTCTLTKNKIWLLLGMLNVKYQRITQKELKRIDDRMTSYEINNFYQRCNQKLNKTLSTALKNLSNRCLISYYEQTVIVEDDFKTKVADDKEIKLIDAVKKSTLEDMGLDDIVQVFCKFKSDEFYKKVNDKLFDLYGWNYSYKRYKIIYTPENIAKAVTKQEMELAKLSLNEKIIEAIDLQADNNYKKQNDKFLVELKKWGYDGLQDEFGIVPNDFDIFSYPECYVEIQRMLSRELLQIGNKKLYIPENEALSVDEIKLFVS